jgi:hypothetical protein
LKTALSAINAHPAYSYTPTQGLAIPLWAM